MISLQGEDKKNNVQKKQFFFEKYFSVKKENVSLQSLLETADRVVGGSKISIFEISLILPT